MMVMKSFVFSKIYNIQIIYYIIIWYSHTKKENE